MNKISSTSDLGRVLFDLLTTLRTMHWHYYNLHWQSKGVPSYSDHLLYQRMYEGMVVEIDGLAEKIIGLTGDVIFVSDLHTMQHGYDTLKLWHNAATIPEERALFSEMYLQEQLSYAYDLLKERGHLTLGLDDFLMTLASSHETNIYLLRQRAGFLRKQASEKTAKIERVFYSKTPYTNFRNVPQITSAMSFQKPKGLWYSCGNSWKEFVEENEWQTKYNHVYRIVVNSSKILNITNEKQFLAFVEKYGIQEGEARRNDWGWSNNTYIDWKAVSKDWAGIEICPYLWSMRREWDWYYTWDVASGCIWGAGGIKGIEDITPKTGIEWDYHDSKWASDANRFFDNPEKREVREFQQSGAKSNVSESGGMIPPTPSKIIEGTGGGKEFSTLSRYIIKTEQPITGTKSVPKSRDDIPKHKSAKRLRLTRRE